MSLDLETLLEGYLFRVNYSSHSSYSELMQFLDVVRPCRLLPINEINAPRLTACSAELENGAPTAWTLPDTMRSNRVTTDDVSSLLAALTPMMMSFLLNGTAEEACKQYLEKLEGQGHVDIAEGMREIFDAAMRLTLPQYHLLKEQIKWKIRRQRRLRAPPAPLASIASPTSSLEERRAHYAQEHCEAEEDRVCTSRTNGTQQTHPLELPGFERKRKSMSSSSSSSSGSSSSSSSACVTATQSIGPNKKAKRSLPRSLTMTTTPVVAMQSRWAAQKAQRAAFLALEAKQGFHVQLDGGGEGVMDVVSDSEEDAGRGEPNGVVVQRDGGAMDSQEEWHDRYLSEDLELDQAANEGVQDNARALPPPPRSHVASEPAQKKKKKQRKIKKRERGSKKDKKKKKKSEKKQTESETSSHAQVSLLLSSSSSSSSKYNHKEEQLEPGPCSKALAFLASM
jgi:hypothetical protein